MNKDLKKCYECLDLSFNATTDEVKVREKALIKIYNNKALEKGVSCDKEKGLIETSAHTIIENIKKNGIPKEETHRFECSWKSVGILSIILVFVAIICFFSFYIFF